MNTYCYVAKIAQVVLVLVFMTVIVSKASAAAPAVIILKTPAHWRAVLIYKSAESNSNGIIFRNDGNKDSVITQTADLPQYTSVFYSVIYQGIIENSIYLRNGDTVELEINKDYKLLSKTPTIPIIENILKTPNYFSERGPELDLLKKGNMAGYYTMIEDLDHHNRLRIDSNFQIQNINKDLRDLLYQQADAEYNLMKIYLIDSVIRLPENFRILADDAAAALKTEPAIVSRLSPDKSHNLMFFYCKYLSIRSGQKTDLRSLSQYARESNWSKKEVITFLSQRLDWHPDKNSPMFKETYQSLIQYAGSDQHQQLVALKKRYFPSINQTGKVLLLKDDGSPTNLAAQLKKGSWCIPCREALPALRRMKDKFSGKPVSFVGISLDADGKENAWLTALKQEKLFGKPNQFKLINTRTSPLFENLEIPSIPRYIVLNSKGKILSSDFYGPEEEKFAIQLNKYLKNQK
jgi:thiol-disulfide isomerase/thioredoxin